MQPCKLPGKIYIYVIKKSHELRSIQFNSNTHCADEYFGSVDNVKKKYSECDNKNFGGHKKKWPISMAVRRIVVL